jgi:transcriptional regulator with XRE-family HTH domain
VVEELGDLIERARKNAGLTQSGLAARAGTSQPAIARYERGVVTPTIATASRLLAACGRELSVTLAAADDVELLGLPVDVATPDMLKDRARAKVLAEAVPL